MMRGHNERAMRLDILAADARGGLDLVARGETDAITGWLAYGAALNEGRSLFPSDEQFGQWVEKCGLSQVGTHEMKRDERIAAMWAAANADQFEEARAAGDARTVRGVYAKWQEIAAERIAAEERAKAEAARLEASAHAKAQAEAEEEKRKARSQVMKAEAAKRAKEAAKAKADAEKKAAQAEKAATRAEKKGKKAPAAPSEAAAPAPEAPAVEAPAPTPDPYGYAGLTEAALLETANGLRAEVDDLRAERRSLIAERDELKSEMKQLLAASDLGPAVSQLKAQLGAVKRARDEAMRETKRMEYRMNAAFKERDEALRKLGEQVIPLDY